MLVVKLFSVSIMLGLLTIFLGCTNQEPPPPGLNKTQVEGWKLLETKWCYSCHIIKDKGSRIGPELTLVGKKRDKEWLKMFLLNPQSVFANAKMKRVNMSEKELNSLTEYLMTLK